MKLSRYFITLNNWTCFDYEYACRIGRRDCKYSIIASEHAKTTGTAHLHIYFKFRNKRSFRAIQKVFPRANIQRAEGTDEQIRAYCSKEMDPQTFGKPSRQGQRTDLHAVAEEVKARKRTCEEILLEEPTVYHIYGRVLEAIESVVMRKSHRTFRTRGIWYWGKSGRGKSYRAFNGYELGRFYVKPLDEKDCYWWDAYKQQEIVIMDEFRGQLSFDVLLKICDEYPYVVSRRGREPVPFLSKEVRITSCYHPNDIYKEETLETMEQLYRRFTITELIWFKDSCLHIENCKKINYLSSIRFYFSGL